MSRSVGVRRTRRSRSRCRRPDPRSAVRVAVLDIERLAGERARHDLTVASEVLHREPSGHRCVPPTSRLRAGRCRSWSQSCVAAGILPDVRAVGESGSDLHPGPPPPNRRCVIAPPWRLASPRPKPALTVQKGNNACSASNAANPYGPDNPAWRKTAVGRASNGLGLSSSAAGPCRQPGCPRSVPKSRRACPGDEHVTCQPPGSRKCESSAARGVRFRTSRDVAQALGRAADGRVDCSDSRTVISRRAG